MRKCIACGLEANSVDDLELFVKSKDSRYGRMNRCKKCWSLQIKTRRGDDRGYLKHLFSQMKQRCYNLKTHNYLYYGGRGITVCQEWLENPESFIKWALSNGFSRGLFIDRIDNEEGYAPDNCRWVDALTSRLNSRNRTTDIDAKTRRCSSCVTVKPLEDFPQSKGRFMGRGYTCKACLREYKKTY